MITTVTLNASIDKIYTLPHELSVGTVQRVATELDNAGGKGLNCARAIATCGEHTIATGFVGGHNGAYLCERLCADGIEHDFVTTNQETRCCLNIIESTKRSTEFLEPGRRLEPSNIEQLEHKVEMLAARSDVVTLNGSVPLGCPDTIYQTLIHRIRTAGSRAFLDTSGALLSTSLDAHPALIKPNTDEICELLGRMPTSRDELSGAARELRETFGIETVVISLGKDGALMSCAEGEFLGTPPHIDVVNTVGSGDTMVGSWAVASARHMSPSDQLRFGLACASANCLTPATGNFEMSAARELMEQTQIFTL